MSKLSASFLLMLVIMCCLTKVQSGPVSCVACITAAGSFSGTGFSAAGGCFALGFPPAVCTCLAGLGLSVSVATVIYCLPICLALTP